MAWREGERESQTCLVVLLEESVPWIPHTWHGMTGRELQTCLGVLLEEMAVEGLHGNVQLLLLHHKPDVYLGGSLTEHQHLCTCAYMANRGKTVSHNGCGREIEREREKTHKTKT